MTVDQNDPYAMWAASPGISQAPKTNSALTNTKNWLNTKWDSLNGTYGGAGNYGYVNNGDSWVGVSKDAFDAVGNTAPTMSAVEFSKTNPNGPGWFGSGGYLSTAGQAIGGLGSLLSGYAGIKALGLAEDKFDFEKGLGLANLYNAGTLANEDRMNRAETGLALAGNTLTDEQKAARIADVTKNNVRTTLNG